MKHWMFLTVTLAAGLFARQVCADDQPGPLTNSPPVIPTDQVPPPAKAPAKSEKKKKASASSKTPAATGQKSTANKSKDKAPAPTGLSPGPAVVKQNSVNVRGQAAINSEIVTHLKKGEEVSVLEEVTLKKPKTDEPAKWAKIALPASATVWVHAGFIDPNNKTVVPKKLKVRSGPGENYSVLGIISKGTAVKEVETKGDWIKIEAPAGSYAFVAAHFLAKEPATAVAAAPPPKPVTETALAAPTPAAIANDNVVSAPVPLAPARNTIAPPPVPIPDTPPKSAAEPLAPARSDTILLLPPEPEETLVKRVVTREGIVKLTASIQSPTYFALGNLQSGKTINYLHSTNASIDLKAYFDKRIIVTGEEMLDERWPHTPVIEIETLQPVP